VSTENLLRVLRIIGIMDVVVKSADPYETDVGRPMRRPSGGQRRRFPTKGYRVTLNLFGRQCCV
jgi:ABC-type protease/lipase transport system fused ATPase/permease subunit